MKVVELPDYEVTDKATLDAVNTAVIVVDMQNDFVHPAGSLYVPTAQEIIPNIKGLLSKARESSVIVVYTQDCHREKDPEFEIWPVHTVMNTWGAEIVEELRPRDEDYIINKTRYDAFYGTPLDYILRTINIKNIVITGTVSNICVLHTAGSAALRGYKIVLPVDCIASLCEFDQELTKRQISFLYKGILISSGGIEFK